MKRVYLAIILIAKNNIKNKNNIYDWDYYRQRLFRDR